MPEDHRNNNDDRSLDIYFREIHKKPVLTKTEEKHYFEVYKNSNDEREREYARTTLLERNQRFVVNRAKRYYRPGGSLTFMDLIEEGNIGLIKAFEEFDYLRGYRFMTYAVWWIDQAIQTAIADKNNLVRLPKSHSQDYSKLGKLECELENELERKPDENDLVENCSQTIERVRHLRKHAIKPYLSLDAPMNEDDDAPWINNLPDDKMPGTDHATHYNSMKEDLEDCLQLLDNNKERIILRLYHGLELEERLYDLLGDEEKERLSECVNGDDVGLTLGQIGYVFSITRERVRQIKERALRKLKHPRRAAYLKEHID